MRGGKLAGTGCDLSVTWNVLSLMNLMLASVSSSQFMPERGSLSVAANSSSSFRRLIISLERTVYENTICGMKHSILQISRKKERYYAVTSYLRIAVRARRSRFAKPPNSPSSSVGCNDDEEEKSVSLKLVSTSHWPKPYLLKLSPALHVMQEAHRDAPEIRIPAERSHRKLPPTKKQTDQYIEFSVLNRLEIESVWLNTEQEVAVWVVNIAAAHLKEVH